MKRITAICLLLVLVSTGCLHRFSGGTSKAHVPDSFVFGAATSAYQVEGAWEADGKGPSVLDFYTNQVGIAGGATGNVAIDQYNRFGEDIDHLRRMGVQAYRFSVAWSRILPGGTGTVNEAGLAHYGAVVDSLLAAGIEPVITLYHQDLPLALARQGGWRNPDSPIWFGQYARILFDAYGDRVKTWITINEPYIETMHIGSIVNGLMDPTMFDVPGNALVHQIVDTHHILLAHSEAVRQFRDAGSDGRIGITLSLAPVYPASPEDVAAARLEDGILNRWFLDAVLRGTYPTDVMAVYESADLDEDLQDIGRLADVPPDFIGVNYYAPRRVRAEEGAPRFDMVSVTDVGDSQLGEVYPEGLYDLLLRLHSDYGAVPLIITENGCGFGAEDEEIVHGTIKDRRRVAYLKDHLRQVGRALEVGVSVSGYFHWAAFDHFEYTNGYNHRYGLIHVDFESQQRVWKNSAYAYRDIMQQRRFPPVEEP